MSPIREQAADRIRRDHDHLIDPVRRIKASCTQSDKVDNCDDCEFIQTQLCHGNIEQLVRSFVEVTLKHNLIESLYMEEGVPQTHRAAHNQAHMEMAEQMKAIRVVFSKDGNCVLAIEGIDSVLAALQAHFELFDRQLEGYLLTPA